VYSGFLLQKGEDMALSRNIQLSFWTDAKVIDDFTPEDRYFFLYLMTNPHTNLCGCYEISKKQMSDETGYTKEVIEKLINRMANMHQVVKYSNDTKEMIILNWSKYNWTESSKLRIALEREIEMVKDAEFKRYLSELLNGNDTVSIPYAYTMDNSVYTNTLNANTLNTETLNAETQNTKSVKKSKPAKQIYGVYQHVKLTDDEYKKLCDEYGDIKAGECITYLDEYMEMKGNYKANNHYLCIRKWVADAVEENKLKHQNRANNNGYRSSNKVADQLDDFYSMIGEWASESEGKE
jgi:hypothetical protein